MSDPFFAAVHNISLRPGYFEALYIVEAQSLLAFLSLHFVFNISNYFLRDKKCRLGHVFLIYYCIYPQIEKVNVMIQAQDGVSEVILYHQHISKSDTSIKYK